MHKTIQRNRRQRRQGFTLLELLAVLAIMGLTAMVVPVPVPDVIKSVDIWVMLAAALAFVGLRRRAGK